MSKHKNSNEAVGNYGIYEIFVDGKTYKIGKADIDRIVKYSNDPVRIHQQVRKLRTQYGNENVYYQIVQWLFGYTTAQAKALEQEILSLVIAQMGNIPAGNQKSYQPKK